MKKTSGRIILFVLSFILLASFKVLAMEEQSDYSDNPSSYSAQPEASAPSYTSTYTPTYTTPTQNYTTPTIASYNDYTSSYMSPNSESYNNVSASLSTSSYTAPTYTSPSSTPDYNNYVDNFNTSGQYGPVMPQNIWQQQGSPAYEAPVVSSSMPSTPTLPSPYSESYSSISSPMSTPSYTAPTYTAPSVTQDISTKNINSQMDIGDFSAPDNYYTTAPVVSSPLPSTYSEYVNNPTIGPISESYFNNLSQQQNIPSSNPPVASAPAYNASMDVNSDIAYVAQDIAKSQEASGGPQFIKTDGSNNYLIGIGTNKFDTVDAAAEFAVRSGSGQEITINAQGEKFDATFDAFKNKAYEVINQDIDNSENLNSIPTANPVKDVNVPLPPSFINSDLPATGFLDTTPKAVLYHTITETPLQQLSGENSQDSIKSVIQYSAQDNITVSKPDKDSVSVIKSYESRPVEVVDTTPKAYLYRTVTVTPLEQLSGDNSQDSIKSVIQYSAPVKYDAPISTNLDVNNSSQPVTQPVIQPIAPANQDYRINQQQ